MRVGIIAEGPSDVAVLRNILKGAIGLDSEFTQALRPELHRDETDLHAEARFSNWELVRKECREGAKIEAFLASPIDEGPRWIVIHIDAAEASAYGVSRPADRREEDVVGLLDAVAQQMRAWLGERASAPIELAIAVQETEAWVLPLYREVATDRLPNVKERLGPELRRRLSDKECKRILAQVNVDPYRFGAEVSARLRKRKELERCAALNSSLKQLVDALRRRGEEAGLGAGGLRPS